MPSTMIAAFETSGAMVSLAVTRGDGQVYESSYPGLRQLATTLMPALLELCEQAGVRLRECEGAAASLGPGSFTGLRVGVAAANALALAVGCPLVGVPSLEVTAHSAVTDAPTLLCLSPHRRGSFYGQEFGKAGDGWVVAGEIEVGSVAEIVAASGMTEGVVCGPEDAREQWLSQGGAAGASIPFLVTYPSARILLALGVERRGQARPRFAVPLYVRGSQPEEKERAAPGGR